MTRDEEHQLLELLKKLAEAIQRVADAVRDANERISSLLGVIAGK